MATLFGSSLAFPRWEREFQSMEISRTRYQNLTGRQDFFNSNGSHNGNDRSPICNFDILPDFISKGEQQSI